MLKAVVDLYIETAEPVGSKAIVEYAGLGFSSATIRSEMAELENMGYLEQPHTSAGRIPSPLGYRVYVNELMRQQKLSIDETEKINSTLKAKIQELDDVLSDAGQLTSELTNYPAIALSSVVTKVTIERFDLIYIDANSFIIVVMLSNKKVKNKLIHLPCTIEQKTLTKLSTQFNACFTNIGEEGITPILIASAERATNDTVGLVNVISTFAIEVLTEEKNSHTYTAGTSHILEHPEYRDVDKAQKLMKYLSDDSKLANLTMPDDNSDVHIMIGPENVADELKDSSVIVASYNIGNNMQGLIGVVGPTRMDYAKVAAKLKYIANGLSGIMNAGGFPQMPQPGRKDIKMIETHKGDD